MDGPFSKSVLGFRPFTLTFPTDVANTINSRVTDSSAATTITSRTIPTRAILNPHIVSDDSPSTSVLTIVLPTLFGALFILGAFIGITGYLSHRRRRKRSESAKLRKKSGVTPAGYNAAEWQAGRREMIEVELNELDQQTFDTLKAAAEVAQVRRAASFKTYDLPRKPPPAYEP